MYAPAGKKFALASIAALLLAAAPVLAAGQTQTAPTRSKTLYERLGGKEGIRTVVEDFVGRVGADERINKRFATTDLARLKAHLTDQICQAVEGPCTYGGRDMKSVHAGMGITSAEFGALVEDMMAALKQANVSKKDQGTITGILLSMKADVVEKP